jgi:hypothetical protein
MDLKVYTLDSELQWDKTLIDHFQDQVDVYYRPGYLRSWLAHEGAEPMCMHIQDQEQHWLYPFFKKEIFSAEESESYYDIYSAYGYGGIVSNKPAYELSDKFRITANLEIDRWCQQNNIVAEFIRENPLLIQSDSYYRNIAHCQVRRNVYAHTNENHKIGSRSARRNILRAKRNGLKVEIDDDLNSYDQFSELYLQTAKRLNMEKYYYFDCKYFKDVREHLLPWSKIINVVAKEILVASALFFLSGGYAAYHLSCSDAAFLKRYPNDLLVASVVDESINGGAQLLNLGGGMSTNSRDSLFEFKRRFGSEVRPVHIGKRIHLKKHYDRLCQKWERRHPTLASRYGHYFLKYRILP